MPPDLAKRVFKTWAYKMQRGIGAPFRYIRVTDYGPHPMPEIIFYVVADLSLNFCSAACSEWCMGEASVSPLDEICMDNSSPVVSTKTTSDEPF